MAEPPSRPSTPAAASDNLPNVFASYPGQLPPPPVQESAKSGSPLHVMRALLRRHRVRRHGLTTTRHDEQELQLGPESTTDAEGPSSSSTSSWAPHQPRLDRLTRKLSQSSLLESGPIEPDDSINLDDPELSSEHGHMLNFLRCRPSILPPPLITPRHNPSSASALPGPPGVPDTSSNPILPPSLPPTSLTPSALSETSNDLHLPGTGRRRSLPGHSSNVIRKRSHSMISMTSQQPAVIALPSAPSCTPSNLDTIEQHMGKDLPDFRSRHPTPLNPKYDEGFSDILADLEHGVAPTGHDGADVMTHDGSLRYRTSEEAARQCTLLVRNKPRMRKRHKRKREQEKTDRVSDTASQNSCGSL